MLVYGETTIAYHISQTDSCHKRLTSLKKKGNGEHQTLRAIKEQILGDMLGRV